MSDLCCTACQASVSVIPGGNLYACGHLLCSVCGADSVCRLDGSYTVIQDQDVFQSIQKIKGTYQQLLKATEAANWDLYYASVQDLTTLLSRKYSSRCPAGHTHGNEGCQACMPSVSLSSQLSETPNFCPNCRIVITVTCPHCHYRDLSSVSIPPETGDSPSIRCSQCGAETTGEEICTQCKDKNTQKAQKYWACWNCRYKYCSTELMACPNCHSDRK